MPEGFCYDGNKRLNMHKLETNMQIMNLYLYIYYKYANINDDGAVS